MGYFPDGDTQAAIFTQNFATVFEANAIKYGGTLAIAAEYITLQQDYSQKLATCQAGPTRTKAACAAKNQAKKALRAETARLVKIIRGQKNLTDQDLIDIGLSPIKPRQSHSAPTESPILQGKAIDPRLINIILRDGLTHRDALPEGVAGASFFSYVGTTPPTLVSDWSFRGSVTRATCQIDASEIMGDEAGMVWICAFYFNSKAQSGPVSPAIAFALPAKLPNVGGGNVSTPLGVAA